MARSHHKLLSIQTLCEIYNHPQRTFPTIHVAGTNGKGSVCTKMASSLQDAGYVTGLYTSPHISTFRERIQIGGELISEASVNELLSEIKKISLQLELPATFFDIATLLAFLYFQRQKVDIGIIETGLGGRWDATNVVSPLVSVISSIGYDHTDLIGNSLEDIVYEKGGIIKEHVPIVIGPDVPSHLIEPIAHAKKSALYQNRFRSRDYDRENQETARLALSLIKDVFPIPEKSLSVGLKKKPPCRFEIHHFEKEVIFDVAHNPQGITRLLELLCDRYPHHQYRFVVGFSKNKEIIECAYLLQEKAIAIHIVSSSHYRLATTHDIEKQFPSRKNLHLEETISSGMQNALKAKHKTPEVVIVTGSFFIMSEARKSVGIEETQDTHLWYDPFKVLEISKESVDHSFNSKESRNGSCRSSRGVPGK